MGRMEQVLRVALAAATLSFASLEIVELDLQNINTIREANPQILILLHAPDKEISDFVTLDEHLRSSGQEIQLATVEEDNVPVLSELGWKEGDGTGLFLLRDKNLTPYHGLKTNEDIAKWLIKKQGAVLFEEKGGLKALVEREKSIIVGFFDSADSSPAKIYNRVAGDMDLVSFYIVTDPDIMKENFQGDCSIIIIKEYEEKEAYFFGEITEERLKAWVKKESIPQVIEFKQENAFKVMTNPRLLHFILVSNTDDPEHATRIEKMQVVATNYDSEIQFVHVDLLEENIPLMRLLSVSQKHLPAMYLFNVTDGNRYMSPHIEVSVSNINQFIVDYKAGKVKKSLRSALPPKEENEMYNVKTLVNINYRSVLEQNKNVYIMMYAPWCDDSKEFSQIWDSLGGEFGADPNNIIAEMDIVANELTDVLVEKLPTIVWTNKNSSTIKVYHGLRDYESLRAFIKSEGEEIIYGKKEKISKIPDKVKEKKRKQLEEEKGTTSQSHGRLPRDEF